MVANEEIITTSIVFILKALKTFVFVILLFPFLYFVAVIISKIIKGEEGKEDEKVKKGDDKFSLFSLNSIASLITSMFIMTFVLLFGVPLGLSSKSLMGLVFTFVILLVFYLPFAFYFVFYSIELFEKWYEEQKEAKK